MAQLTVGRKLEISHRIGGAGAGAARRGNETRTKTHQPDTLATASQAPLSSVSPHKCDSWINKVSSLENVFGQL